MDPRLKHSGVTHSTYAQGHGEEDRTMTTWGKVIRPFESLRVVVRKIEPRGPLDTPQLAAELFIRPPNSPSPAVEAVDKPAAFDLVEQARIHNIFGLDAARFGIRKRFQGRLYFLRFRQGIFAWRAQRPIEGEEKPA